MAKVIEKVDAHYDVKLLEFGRVYEWRPASVLLECECGEVPTLTASDTACEECGTQHATLVREDSREPRLEADEAVHPWRYATKDDDETSLPY